jgi:protein TonB
MLKERILRPAVFAAAALLHAAAILFLAFNVASLSQEAPENARVMKLTDLAELPPPEPEEEIPLVEEIAETMIETDIPPVQIIVPAGTITDPAPLPVPVQEPEIVYLQMHEVSVAPTFRESEIARDLSELYPPIALRAGIEGRVILELFVDNTGVVISVNILREDPEGRGFGEAAIKAFMGRRGTPATANGQPVSCRYRWPVTFKVK